MVLAGGFATRLGPIGREIPKAMITTEGDTALNHLLKKLEAEGIEPIISVNRKFEKFFGGYRNVLVEQAMAEEEKLGAVSAIDNAVKRFGIDEDLLVVCVDNYFSSDFKGFISSYTGEPLVGVYHVGQKPYMKPEEMATMRFEGSDRYPPPEDSFYITELKEKVKPPLSDYVGTGVYILPRRVFSTLDEFCRGRTKDAPGFFIQHLIERGERIKGYLFGGEWYDVSHKSYLQAFRDAELVRSDETCIRCDKPLGSMMLSLEILHPGKQTEGRSHREAEVCFIVEGEGEIELEGKRREVGGKDVVLIRPDEFHRVLNPSGKYLIFTRVAGKSRA